MKLEIDKSALTIMGIPFSDKRDSRGVWHALSTNMFEGWVPNKNDVLRLKEKAEALRDEANATQTV
jgi:hypothetical protein